MLPKKDNPILPCTHCSFAVAMRIFSQPHKKFYLRELARETGYSTTAVSESIELLHMAKVIKLYDGPITKEISADFDSEAYRYNKIIFNLTTLVRNSVITLLVEAFKNPECIVLFGSYAKGEDTEESDIDLLIVTPKKEPENKKQFTRYLSQWEEELKRRMNLHILSTLETAEPAFKNAVANGIVLHGYLKVI